MKEEFWRTCWERNEIGFHLSEVNPVLKKYWKQVPLSAEGRVLVPLCGKSLDLAWLSGKGYEVVGVELSRLAVEAFLLEQNLFLVSKCLDEFELFSGSGYELWCGNIFNLSGTVLQSIGAVYDRGSLVAFPREMRERYMAKLIGHLPKSASWLLVTLEYDENIMQGPPFHVGEEEVRSYFRSRKVERLEQEELIGTMPKARGAGLESIVQSVYLVKSEK